VLVLWLAISFARPPALASVVAGLAVLAPFVFAGWAGRQSRERAAEFQPAFDKAWVAAATDLARARGELDASTLAKLTASANTTPTSSSRGCRPRSPCRVSMTPQAGSTARRGARRESEARSSAARSRTSVGRWSSAGRCAREGCPRRRTRRPRGRRRVDRAHVHGFTATGPDDPTTARRLIERLSPPRAAVSTPSAEAARSSSRRLLADEPWVGVARTLSRSSWPGSRPRHDEHRAAQMIDRARAGAPVRRRAPQRRAGANATLRIRGRLRSSILTCSSSSTVCCPRCEPST